MPFKDKLLQKESAKRHYEKNKEKMIEKAKFFKKQGRKRNKEFIREYLSNHPCVDCGESDIIVLEFDHVKEEKFFNIGDSKDRSIKSIEKEIAKCEVRCANCHRRITHLRRQK